MTNDIPPEILTNEALIVRPGDHLIVRVAEGGYTDEDAQRWREEILRRIPALGDVSILTGVDQVAAYRPDPTPTGGHVPALDPRPGPGPAPALASRALTYLESLGGFYDWWDGLHPDLKVKIHGDLVARFRQILS
jgi:hypothetical protein